MTLVAALWVSVSVAEAAPVEEGAGFRSWAELSSQTRDLVDRMGAEYAKWEWRAVCVEEMNKVSSNGDESCKQCRGYQRMELEADGSAVGDVTRFRSPECGRSGFCLRSEVPEPLDWLALLREPLRSSLRFAEEVRIAGFHDELVLRWASSAPSRDVTRVTSWSGEFIIDPHTETIREVRARPSWDAATREARRLRYQTATSVNLLFVGFKLAPRPTLLDLHVRFDAVAKELTWPSSFVLEKREASTRDSDVILWRRNTVFHSWRFFETSTRESIDTIGAAP